MKARQETTIDKNRNCPKRANPNVNTDKLMKPNPFNTNRLSAVKAEVSVMNLSSFDIDE